MKRTILLLLTFITISFGFISCNKNVKTTYNKVYCEELRKQMIDLLTEKISNDSMYIVKQNEICKFIEDNNFVINSSNATILERLENELNEYVSYKFNNLAFESYKSELLKEYYDIDNDKEINDLIKSIDKFIPERNVINEKKSQYIKKIKFNIY
jgi:hypothetical protein